MPYEIEWQHHGAIKHFSGEVAGSDLVESEQRIASHPNFTSLRYVVSVYLDAERMAASIEERRHLRAIELGRVGDSGVRRCTRSNSPSSSR